MKKFIVLLLCCFLNSSALADEPTPRDQFEFDEDGNVKTDNGKAERTFWFPPLKVGFLVDLQPDNRDVAPHLSIELFDFSDFAFNAGVAQSRVFLSFGWEIVPIAKIGPIVWGGYNVKDETWAAGLGVSILDF